jgi:hypothetical protein
MSLILPLNSNDRSLPLNMELDLQSLFGLLCTAVLGRYWTAKTSLCNPLENIIQRAVGRHPSLENAGGDPLARGSSLPALLPLCDQEFREMGGAGHTPSQGIFPLWL